MAKRGEISAEKKSDRTDRTFVHSAPLDQVLRVREQVESAGFDWHKDAVPGANLSRNVGYTLLRGEGSLGSLRRIEEWLSKKQVDQDAKKSRTPREQWAQLADELESLGADQFDITIEGLQEYIRAEKRRRAAFHKLLRVNPDPQK